MKTTETDELLCRELDALEGDGFYQTVRVLRTRPTETTELVRRDGVDYIRKSFRVSDDPIQLQDMGTVYQLLRQIHDPHLARVIEAYRLNDTLVVISEYVEGRTLRESIEAAGPLDHAIAYRMMDDICSAVDALHTQGATPLVHRDITPNNIILTERGAKLIDCGIVRRYNREKAHDTRIVGTAGYAAPEQFGFGQTSVASDIYALGMVYRFALTGADPTPALQETIGGDNILQARDRSIIARCIRLNSGERYRSVAQLRQALVSDQTSVPPSSKAGKFLFNHRVGLHRAAVILTSIFFWPVALVGLGAPWKATGPLTTGDFLALLVSDWCMVFLFMFPAYLFICNPRDLLHRLPFFHKNRAAKVIGIVFVGVVVAAIVMSAARDLYSPDYASYLAAQHTGR